MAEFSLIPIFKKENDGMTYQIYDGLVKIFVWMMIYLLKMKVNYSFMNITNNSLECLSTEELSSTLSPLAPKDFLALMVCANCFSKIDRPPSFIYQ